jgi:hypothetical protein
MMSQGCWPSWESPVKKTLISVKNRKAQLQFAKKYECSMSEGWAKVLWTDVLQFKRSV